MGIDRFTVTIDVEAVWVGAPVFAGAPFEVKVRMSALGRRAFTGALAQYNRISHFLHLRST